MNFMRASEMAIKIINLLRQTLKLKSIEKHQEYDNARTK